MKLESIVLFTILMVSSCATGDQVADAGNMTCGELLQDCTCDSKPRGTMPGTMMDSGMCDTGYAVYGSCAGCCVHDVHAYCVEFPWTQTCGCDG